MEWGSRARYLFTLLFIMDSNASITSEMIIKSIRQTAITQSVTRHRGRVVKQRWSMIAKLWDEMSERAVKSITKPKRVA